MRRKSKKFVTYLPAMIFIGLAILIVSQLSTSVVFGAHEAWHYEFCPAGPPPGANGTCDPNSPPNYFSNIAQNVPWCQNTGHTYTCFQACGGPSPCDEFGYEWFYHPTQDFGYLFQGTCSISGTPCQGADTSKGWFAARGCSEPTVNTTYCGAVPGPGPTATCSPSSQSASIGQQVSFTGTASNGEAPYSYSWSAPGGAPSSGSGANFNNVTYATNGTKTVTLTVTDDDGGVDTDQCTVNVGVGGGGSVSISPLNAKAQPAGVSPYQDSLIYNSTPLTVDVEQVVDILSGCTVGNTCDIRFRVDCTNDGTFDGGALGYSGQRNSPPTYIHYFANHCTYSSPGSYTLRGRVEVWPQSNPADITSAEDLVPITITAPPPVGPTVNLSASPTSVAVGGSSTLTWSTTNATSCAASSGWAGSKGTSGSEVIAGIVANTTFRLDCGGPGGTAFDTASVTISGPNPDVSVGITAVNNSGSFDLRDIKNGDRITFEIEYRNAGSGNATSIQNVEINLSGNHQYVSGSLDCPVSGPNCNNVSTSNQQITFNRNAALGPGNSFTVRFDSVVSTGQNQPLEILTLNTSGIYNPGAIGFDETYALIAGANREPSPGFREVAP